MKLISKDDHTIEDLAAIVSEKLKEHELDCILVGGGCVSIYSQNNYQSYDLDYVSYDDIGLLTKALKEIGFEKEGKYFKHIHSQFFIEFVSPPVAIGEEPIHTFKNYKSLLGTIKMLTPTDCVKDRLASYYHWSDTQALEQALMVCKEMHPQINFKNIQSWSVKEGKLEKHKTFLKKYLELRGPVHS